jgi:hypothetical protein
MSPSSRAKPEHAKTFGSLIQIPYALKTHLAVLPEVLALVKQSGDMYASAAADDLLPLVQQAQMLAMQFDAVVANPPYMGAKNMSPSIKGFIAEKFQEFKADIFSAFISRCLFLAKPNAPLAFVCPYLWMFIGSYEELRKLILSQTHLTSLVQLEYNAFEPACIPISTFSIVNTSIPNYVGGYIRLTNFKGHESQAPKTRQAISDENCGWFYRANQAGFSHIPGNCIAFWIGQALHRIYSNGVPLGSIAAPRQGLATADNGRFLRRWFEVSVGNVAFNCASKSEAALLDAKWFPHNKGGNFRRWYGNNEYIINWKDDGTEIKSFDKAVVSDVPPDLSSS